MDLIPIQYLHIESLVTPLFLIMMLFVQLSRTADAGYFTQAGREQWKWLSAIFIVLTIGFTGLLANVSPLLALELSIGFTLALMHPANAFCLFVHMLYLRPWEIIDTNPLLLAMPRLLAVLCFFSWLVHFRLHATLTRRSKRGLMIVAIFSVWLLLSTFVTPHPTEAQSDLFQGYFRSLIVFVMALYFLESEHSITQLQLTMVISTFGLMAVGGYEYYVDQDPGKRFSSVGGLFGDPNDMAAIIVMTLPLAFISVVKRNAGLVRQLHGLAYSMAGVVVIWFTKSRGAMLGMASQLLVLPLFLRSKSRVPIVVLLAIFLGAGYVGMLKVLPRSSDDLGESSQSRLTYWKAAVNMTVRNPVFGVGYNQYPVNFDAYSSGTKYEFGVRTCHSSWFLAYAESGLLGGTLFLMFFISVLRMAWRGRFRHPEHFLAVVGYGVGMSFLSHTYSMFFYLLAGLVMASDEEPMARQDA